MKYLALLFALVACSACQAQSTEVNLYSARKEALIRPLLDAFTKQTGIKVNVLSSKADALLKRIQSESLNSPADVLLTTDAGRLYRAKNADIFETVESSVLNTNIPVQYRDSDNKWFGLSIRLRPIMVTNNVKPDSIERYEDLAKPQFKGKVCVRSSSNIYNQSLVASIIEESGEEAAQNWAEGLVANFARKPQGGDRDQVRAAAIGQCSIAVVNTYYLAQMLADQTKIRDFEAAKKMLVIWPNQQDRGAHANVSGAGLLKTAPNRANGIKLLEYLSSASAQQIYADVNYEYPVKDGIAINSILGNWGAFKADPIKLERLGEHNAAAVKLMDRAGWK